MSATDRPAGMQSAAQPDTAAADAGWPAAPGDAAPSDAAAPRAASAGARRARVMAVTSGKGGVGKTYVSANLAAALARRGERVLVLDADLGLANLDVVLNLAPRTTLHDVFTGRAELEDAVTPAPGGFSVLLAGSGLVEYSRLTTEVRDKLVEAIATMAPRYDRIVIDTGAGISDVVLHAVSLAEEVLLVVTSEPTAMTDAYATIKVLSQQQRRAAVQLVVNQTERLGEARTIRNQLQLVIDRFVNPAAEVPVKVQLLGEIPADPAVRESVRRRRLLLEAYPGSPAAKAIGTIAQRLAP